MNDDRFESVLFESLKSNIEPSEKLNDKLKREIRLHADKKTVNLWFLPLLMAIIYDICISLFVIVFIPNIILKTTIIVAISFSLLCIICLTILGLNFFELKKGSVLEL